MGKCYHDTAIECDRNFKCFGCPIFEAIAEDYPH